MKIINDPVFGFIKIPGGLLLDIIKHPLMQRLSRIKQLGMASIVYPGAQHTRFLHSLGAYHLTSEALLSLQQKGVFIFDSEAEAVCAAILMHDIGHGPFSHVLEHTLINGVSHEDISLLMMEQINKEMNGQLNLAISIYKDEYHKKFLHQLISSQLDMDRLDYLRRDAFFTGVSEGNIGSARIIKMLNVNEDKLVVEQKGIYSIENYLTARRLMYWQVYLHKTTVAAEKALVNMLERAKELVRHGHHLFASPSLEFFLNHDVTLSDFSIDSEALRHYEMLDDNDIWSALKVWAGGEDRILSLLAQDMICRRPFKVEVRTSSMTDEEIAELENHLAETFNIPLSDAHYLYSQNVISKDMYDLEGDRIDILFKDGTIKDISDASELFNISLLSQKISKYYVCTQRM